jgi:hypothetical protein
MPEEIVAAAGEGNQPAVSTEVPSPEGQQTSEELFFDNSKLPPELQPTHKEMQAAWTKKVQEVAPWRKLEQYGSAEEVGQFLSQFSEPQGILNWWFQVAQELGVPQEALAKLLQGEQGPGQQNAGQQPDDLAQPMTKQEFLQWQQQQQAVAVRQQEDAEVASALQQLQVPPEIQDQVILAAYRQPFHLGYTERLKRGYTQVQEAQKAYLSRAQGEAARKNEAAPRSMGGSAPGTETPLPKTMDEARARAKARLAGLAEAATE